MSFEISVEVIRRIGQVLGVEAKHEGNHYRFEIRITDASRQLVLEVYPRLPIGESEGALICIYTPNSNLQLQHCSGVVFSDMMGEVTFIAETSDKVSGLIVEREGACSLYANVDRKLLSGDFTKLGPVIKMSSIALSLTDLAVPDEDLTDDYILPVE